MHMYMYHFGPELVLLLELSFNSLFSLPKALYIMNDWNSYTLHNGLIKKKIDRRESYIWRFTYYREGYIVEIQIF